MRRATFPRLLKSTSARRSSLRWWEKIEKEISMANSPATPAMSARRHRQRRSDSNARFRRCVRSAPSQEIWPRVAVTHLFVGTGCRCAHNSYRKETSLSARQWLPPGRSCRVRPQNERSATDLPCRAALPPPGSPRPKILSPCRPRFHQHRVLRHEDRLGRLLPAVKILLRRATTAKAASAPR